MERGEAHAEEEQHEDGDLAHHESEPGGDEGDEEKVGERRPALGERGEMRAHDVGCEEKQREINGQQEPEGLPVGDEREWSEGQRGEGRSEEGERGGHRGDELVLEEFFGGEIVEERGLAGAQHVAGGVVDAEIDGARLNGGAEAEARGQLHDDETGEVELEAFSGEKHRVGSAVVMKLWGV